MKRPGGVPTARVIALNTLRLMAGSDWTPQEIRFTHESPHQTSEHTRIFGAPVRFGCATNAFVIEGAFLERQVPAADLRLYKILQRYLDSILSDLPREDNFLASIRKAIAETMRDGDPGLARVAKQLAASPRTLQRRLKECGLEFQKARGRHSPQIRFELSKRSQTHAHGSGISTRLF